MRLKNKMKIKIDIITEIRIKKSRNKRRMMNKYRIMIMKITNK